MKTKRNRRYRRRPRSSREKQEVLEESSTDKVFADFLKYESSKKQPHMEWDGANFVPTKPRASPTVEVKTTLMVSAHGKFGVKWRGSRKGVYQSKRVDVVADSGCQTCIAGTDLLERIGCPEDFLVPTRHSIVGITRDSCDIVGSVLLRIELDGHVTRQMVHISTKTKGFYLSETALRELNVLSQDFPRPAPQSTAGASGYKYLYDVNGQEFSTPAQVCNEEGDLCVPRSDTPVVQVRFRLPQRRRTSQN